MGYVLSLCFQNEKEKRKAKYTLNEETQDYLEMTERVKSEYENIHIYCMANSVCYFI